MHYDHSHVNQMKKMCHDHLNKYVMVQTHDGMTFDGIVESIDGENVVLAVPMGGEGPMTAPPGQMAGQVPHGSPTHMGPGMPHDSPAHMGPGMPHGTMPQQWTAPMPQQQPGAHTGVHYQPGADPYTLQRQFVGAAWGAPGFGFGPWWGYGPGFGYPWFPGGRFGRLILPLAALTAISTLPYFWW